MPSQHRSTLSSPTTGGAEVLSDLIIELRNAVDHQLDRLVRSGASVPEVVKGLARLEDLLDIFGEYAKTWRPSDLLEALHGDLVTFNAEVSPTFARASVGAFLKQRPKDDSPDPLRHRREQLVTQNVFGPDGVRLETAKKSTGIDRGLV